MEWRATLAAIQISAVPPNSIVHVIDRYRVEHCLQRSTLPLNNFKPAYTSSKVQTYCGCEVDLSGIYAQSEREPTDVNCEACVTEVERQQAYWKQFYRSPEGIQVIKTLSGYTRLEQETRESHQRFEDFYRPLKAFTDLVNICMQHKEPVFTLELPDDILLKLISYGSVGEVLLAFKLDAESRQKLETEIGKAGFSLLGSRLISKGYLKSNDPIFHQWK